MDSLSIVASLQALGTRSTIDHRELNSVVYAQWQLVHFASSIPVRVPLVELCDLGNRDLLPLLLSLLRSTRCSFPMNMSTGCQWTIKLPVVSVQLEAVREIRTSRESCPHKKLRTLFDYYGLKWYTAGLKLKRETRAERHVRPTVTEATIVPISPTIPRGNSRVVTCTPHLTSVDPESHPWLL